MKVRRLLSDPAFMLLLMTNLVIAYEYRRNPGMDGVVMLLYWAQSIMIGGVYFFRVILSPATQTSYGTSSKGCYPYFFLLHYGFFHLGYLFFISIGSASSLQYLANQELRLFFLLSLLSLLVGNILDFVRFHRQDRSTGNGPGDVLFTPYIRIIPMHLFIVLGGIGNQKGLSFDFFILLKTAADLLMYALVYRPLRDKDNSIPHI